MMNLDNVYKHYKGGLYNFLFISKHSETEEDMVNYEHMETGEKWTRPKKMFFEAVGGVPRFRKLTRDEKCMFLEEFVKGTKKGKLSIEG